MSIYHDCIQYSDEYDRLKLGLPTSSNFHRIITPGGKPSTQWRGYACKLIAERILQRKVDAYTSPAMENGLIVEAEAVDWYEFARLDANYGETTPIGFITNDAGTIGCSPDRLVGDDGLLEIKAPMPHTQIEYWLSGEAKEKYRPQVQGQLYISQRLWVDLVCWHDVLPKVVIRIEPDEKFIAALANELDIFNHFIERVMIKIRGVTDAVIPHSRLSAKIELREMLKATLEESP